MCSACPRKFEAQDEGQEANRLLDGKRLRPRSLTRGELSPLQASCPCHPVSRSREFSQELARPLG